MVYKQVRVRIASTNISRLNGLADRREEIDETP